MPARHRPHVTADVVRAHLGPDPVAVADVLALGVTPGQLRAAVAAGTLARPRRGFLTVGTVGTVPGTGRPARTDPWAGDSLAPEIRRAHIRDARAALLDLGDDSVVSHASTALLHGLPFPLPQDGPTAVWVTAPRHGRIVAGTHRRLGLVPEEDRTEVEGGLCSGIARTALDLARRRRLPPSLVVLDAAAARVGRDALWRAADRMTWKRDLRALHTALAVTDPSSESPLESSSRGVMVLAGIGAHELQAWVHGSDGLPDRVDFLWRDKRVIGEADGWVKYRDIDDVRAEKRREDALRQAGFIVVRWTWDELRRHPERVMARLCQAINA